MLKALLKKLADGLSITQEEKDYLVSKSEELSDEQNEAVENAEVVEEAEEEGAGEDGDEEVDEKGLASFIKSEVSKAISNSMASLSPSEKAEEIAKDIKSKRAKGVVDTTKDVNADRKTRDFIKAILSNDVQTLKAMTTADDDTAKAGYNIPEELEAEVQRLVQDQYGIARREMRYLPMSGAGNSRKITTGGAISVYWTDEEGDITSTQATFGRATQTLKKLSAIVPLTEEVISDSAINLTAYVADLFAEAVAKAEDDQFFDGDGTAWTGLLRDSNITAVALGTDETVGSDLTLEDLQAVLDATATPALRNGKWYMNKSVFGVIKMLKDGSSNYIFPDLARGTSKDLLGYPVVLSDSCPASSVTTASRGMILFGDLSKGAVYGDKGGMQVKTSSEATIRNVADNADINLFEQDMVALKVTRRVGYVVTVSDYMTRLTNGASS